MNVTQNLRCFVVNSGKSPLYYRVGNRGLAGSRTHLYGGRMLVNDTLLIIFIYCDDLERINENNAVLA